MKTGEPRTFKNTKSMFPDPVFAPSKAFLMRLQGCAYEVAPGDMRPIVRLCIGLDKFASQRDKALHSKKRYNYKRSLSQRIRNLVNQVQTTDKTQLGPTIVSEKDFYSRFVSGCKVAMNHGPGRHAVHVGTLDSQVCVKILTCMQ